MPVFDQLERASFDGVAFPIKSVHIKCQARLHQHEYLRVPGAVIEKLERGPYTIEMEAVFDANIKTYGPLFPELIRVLQESFENQVTAPLVIPTLGTIPAILTEWDETADMAKIRSGVKMRLPFLEDQTQRFLTDAIVKVDQTNLGTAAKKFELTRKDFDPPPPDVSLFDKIQTAANAVLSIKDRLDLYGALLAAKVEQLISYIRQADLQAQSLQHPENYPLLDALHELWEASVNLHKNLAETPRGPRIYTTPKRMSVSDISVATYGDTTHAVDVMLNNNLTDPFSVPPGTRIMYFLDAA